MNRHVLFVGPSHSISTELDFHLVSEEASEAENFLTYACLTSGPLLSLNGRRTRPLVSAIVVKEVIQN